MTRRNDLWSQNGSRYSFAYATVNLKPLADLLKIDARVFNLEGSSIFEYYKSTDMNVKRL